MSHFCHYFILSTSPYFSVLLKPFIYYCHVSPCISSRLLGSLNTRISYSCPSSSLRTLSTKHPHFCHIQLLLLHFLYCPFFFFPIHQCGSVLHSVAYFYLHLHQLHGTEKKVITRIILNQKGKEDGGAGAGCVKAAWLWSYSLSPKLGSLGGYRSFQQRMKDALRDLN